MNEQWQEKLASLENGASLQVSDSVDSELLTNPDQAVLVELSDLSVVDIAGEEAQTFLQDQVCNDLTVLSDGEMQLNGYCNPKGRLLALFTVFAHDDGLRLIVPTNVVAAFTKRLKMFVLRAKVTIDVRDDLVCSGLVMGAANAAAIIGEFDNLPERPASTLQFTDSSTLQLLRVNDATLEPFSNGTQERFICIGEPDDVFTLWQSAQFKHTSFAYWRWLDINAGTPNVYDASVEQFIPQMVNMQLINGLSFKKGCYPGQEIVARMHYLGKLKKHMKHVRVEGKSSIPKPGDVLATEASNNAGQVVDAVADEQGVNVLAVVNIATPVNDIKVAGVALQEAQMPYPLELKDQTDAANS